MATYCFSLHSDGLHVQYYFNLLLVRMGIFLKAGGSPPSPPPHVEQAAVKPCPFHTRDTYCFRPLVIRPCIHARGCLWTPHIFRTKVPFSKLKAGCLGRNLASLQLKCTDEALFDFRRNLKTVCLCLFRLPAFHNNLSQIRFTITNSRFLTS